MWPLVAVLALVSLSGSTDSATSRDRDHDGLPDHWESRHGLSTTHGSAAGDPDRDGLSNLREYRLRLDPRRRDTDRDGFADGTEVRAHSNPRSRTSTPRRAGSSRCDRSAAPGELAHQLHAASAGETICLADGDYGTFRGARKEGPVTLRPHAGASASMTVELDGAANLVLDGLTIRGAALRGSTRDITIRHSAFTEPATLDGLENANVVLDHDSFDDISGTAARIHLPYTSQTPSGVTIKNSRMIGGDSDGVQSGVGVNIIDNQFIDILENGPNHTDAIQLLDAPGAVVRGNFIRDSSSGIVAYDGLEHAVIEDNVVDLTGKGKRPWGIELYSDDGSVVRHNTVKYDPGCSFNLPCGMIGIDRKSQDPAGQGTVVLDNIATELTISNGSEVASRRGNLLRRGVESGDRRGAPVYEGGSHPASFAGFKLAHSSPGKDAASDGRDVGAG
jgi:hypothetical protein